MCYTMIVKLAPGAKIHTVCNNFEYFVSTFNASAISINRIFFKKMNDIRVLSIEKLG